MTTNQIRYQENQRQQRADAEQRRHNLSVEQETARSNLAREFETERTNKMNERIKDRSNAEAYRHNTTTEIENYRHNLHTETAGYLSASGQFLRGASNFIPGLTSSFPKTPSVPSYGEVPF